MAPKKGKSGKKGHKMTKAQKMKLQKEEEERRLQEEEEARLQAERSECDRLERKKKQQELERLEEKDMQRRDHELNELCHLLEENHTAVTKWKTGTTERAKWERYMCCDGSPDPAVQQDVNTYISLWRDDPEINITIVLKKCDFTLKMIEELEDLVKDTADPNEALKYQESQMNLQELIYTKHLLITAEILKGASINTDTETGNMQTVVKDDNITLCLWANLKKNPRFKGLIFEEAGIGFELPKQLGVSNIAVRILHTCYDHLSLLAKMTKLSIHKLSHRSLAGAENVDIPEEGITNKTQDDMSLEPQTVVEVLSSFGPNRPEAESVTSLRSRCRNGVPPAVGRQSQIQTQIEALNSDDDLISLPEQMSILDPLVQVVDLMEYMSLGGVFYYDVFHLPPQAHYANGWEIRQVLDTGLQVFQYPMEISSLDDEALRGFRVGVCVELPNYAVFLQTPQVSRWDAAGRLWRMDGITDISYEEAEAKISFKMDSFYNFALMQQIYANFPFRSWELQPLGQDSALFTVNGALLNISITIQGNECMLHSEQRKGLSHLMGRWMNVTALQKAMYDAGVNIFVNDYTDKYVNSCGKDPLTEHVAYEQMALFASACAFSWSKWNAKCGNDHLVIKACEHIDLPPVPESTWVLYLLGAQRSQKLEITEESETFSGEHFPGSEFHSTFIHMLQDNMSSIGLARTRASNYIFVDTVQSLLCATRPLMYS